MRIVPGFRYSLRLKARTTRGKRLYSIVLYDIVSTYLHHCKGSSLSYPIEQRVM